MSGNDGTSVTALGTDPTAEFEDLSQQKCFVGCTKELALPNSFTYLGTLTGKDFNNTVRITYLNNTH